MIKVGIIGLGLAATHFHIPLLKMVAPFLITSVLSSKTSKEIESLVGHVNVFTSLTDFCTSHDFELAIVLTPNFLHFDQCKKLLMAGKNVIVDKPFTVTLAEAIELKELASSLGLLLTVFHNRRWDSDFLTIKKMYEANAFGRICYFESRFDKYRPKIAKKWKDQNISGSGILYDLLPHLADQTFQLFGCPQYISATLKSQRETNSVCDYFNVKLIYCDFDVVLRASSFAAHTPFRFYIEGNKGTFIKSGMDVQESNLHLDNFNKKDWVSEDIKNSGVFYQNGSAQTITSVQGDYRCFYNNIANALCANGSLLVTVDDAIAVMKLIELVTLSSQSNQVIAWST